MPTESKLHLILGCWGRIDGDFTSCKSVFNPILRLDESLESYVELIKYLKGLRLFEQKLTNYNAVRGALFTIKNKYPRLGHVDVWDDKKFRLIENFTIVHKFCGLYMDLDFVDDDFFKRYAEERVVVIEPSNK